MCINRILLYRTLLLSVYVLLFKQDLFCLIFTTEVVGLILIIYIFNYYSK